MGQKLDTDREMVTLNGRSLKLVSRTTDGGLVLQALKSRTIVVTDECGCVDGKDYAVNRDILRSRVSGAPRTLPTLRNGQTIYCFRFARRGVCLFRATFVGYAPRSTQTCKVAPEVSILGREVLKVARQQVFDDLPTLHQWGAKLRDDLEALG